MRKKTEEIQSFIIDNVTDHEQDIARFTAERFGISRPAVARHLSSLVSRSIFQATGTTRARKYSLPALKAESFILPIIDQLAEDVVWRQRVSPLIGEIPENVRIICNYGFTEMLCNAVDHSESSTVEITVTITAAAITILVKDSGIGVFKKLMQDFNLYDPRHALLELSKGKLTSDPAKHSGQGIFFTSRMFDEFMLVANGFSFCRFNKKNDWLFESRQDDEPGTSVMMLISPRAKQTAAEITKQYSSELHDYGFTRTVVPIELARYEGEQLVSRSQAKRLLARVEQFKEVLLDFQDIFTIGQAFADEIFRVFVKEHPETHLYPINTKPEIQEMIQRAQSEKVEPTTLPLFEETHQS